MNLTARTEYACLAVMQLAASYGTNEPVRIRTIAQAHGIPSRFLVQILLQLKNAALVSSTRGAAGGYQLLRDPADLTLADVMRVVEGGNDAIGCGRQRETAQARVLLSVWNDAARLQREVFESTTFQSLLERSSSEADHMYYI